MKHHQEVRWLKNGELPEILAMDSDIFEHPWHRNTMQEIVNNRSNLCAVVDDEEGVPAGFMIFEIQRDRFYILKIGVLKKHQRAGYGEELLQFLVGQMTPNRRKIEIDVRESLALTNHGFFSQNSFKATGVHQDFFKVFTIDSEEPFDVEDSYNFQMDLSTEAAPLVPLSGERHEAVASTVNIVSANRDFF